MEKNAKVRMRCPECSHTSVWTNKDGTTFCRYCGHKGKAEEFRQPFTIKL